MNGDDEASDIADELASALLAIGAPVTVEVSPFGGASVDVRIDGAVVTFLYIERAHPTAGDLKVLTDADFTGLIVADRISDAGREVLRSRDWGWLDRRGHLRIWRPGLRIDAAFPVRSEQAVGPRSHGNMWTPLGLEVATYTLVNAGDVVSARAIAREIGRAPSGVHEQVQRFIEAGLIGPTTRRPLLPDLFWETAANWPDDEWIPLPISIEEAVALTKGGRPVRVDDLAATLGGAPIPSAANLTPRFYVYGEANLRRLIRQRDDLSPTRCFARMPPTRWVVENKEVEKGNHGRYPWTIGHPLLCALRLAKNGSRGREIVEAWGIVPEGDG